MKTKINPFILRLAERADVKSLNAPLKGIVLPSADPKKIYSPTFPMEGRNLPVTTHEA